MHVETGWEETVATLTIAMVVDTSGNRVTAREFGVAVGGELKRQGHTVRLVGIGALNTQHKSTMCLWSVGLV